MVLAVRSGMTARLLLVLPCLVLASCGLFEVGHVACDAVDCVPCPPALTVRLQAPAGKLPPEAALEGISGTCGVDPQANRTVCTLNENHAGTFEFDIQAAGYQKVHVSQTVAADESTQGCCLCGYVGRVVDVQLTPQ